MKRALDSKEENVRELLVALRIALGGQNVSWIDEVIVYNFWTRLNFENSSLAMRADFNCLFH